jgi:hypothetical protein
MKLLKLISLLAMSCVAIPAVAADAIVPAAASPTDLISNGGFENGIAGWGIFVPDESKSANCRFDVVSDAPHSGVNCVRLQSDDLARFSIGCPLISVQPGERYHVSVWIRADPAAQIRPQAPGFVIRLYLGQGNVDAEGGHMFIGPGNLVSRNTPADPVSATLPTTWTQIEAVVEIPKGVDKIGPGLFSWWTKGAIFADDFSIQKVDASTAVTSLWQKTPSPSASPTPK